MSENVCMWMSAITTTALSFCKTLTPLIPVSNILKNAVNVYLMNILCCTPYTRLTLMLNYYVNYDL